MGKFSRALVLTFICLGVVTVPIITSCQTQSTYQKTYKALSVSKETIVFVAKTAKVLHANGVIDEVKLSMVQEKYNQLAQAQYLLVEAQKEALDHMDGTKEEQVKTLSLVYLKAMSGFVNLAIELGILGADDERVQQTNKPILN